MIKEDLLETDMSYIKASDVESSYYGDYLSYYEDNYKDAIGEINLWRAVLLQALIDLKTRSKKRRMQPKKKDAYDWFTKEENKEEVEIVCDCAGISYGKIQNIVNKIVRDDNLHAIFSGI